MSEVKKIAIIDGKSVFYRGYYGMPGLTNSKGQPTGGIYGFATIALEIMKELKPDFVYVAWDKSKTNINSRLKIYPEYKAGRKPPPPDFYDQIPYLHKFLDAMGWHLLEADDYEADDIMATLADQGDKLGHKTYLITSDLDMLQAISNNTTIYILKKGFSSITKFNEKEFEQKYGIKLNQFIDYKSLAGDSSDNIPGVAGIGKKTAADLLNQFGDLESIYSGLDKIKSKSTKTKLVSGREMAYISKKLVTLMKDAPFTLHNLDKDESIDVTKLKLIMNELEFRHLQNSLDKTLQDIGYKTSENVKFNDEQAMTISTESDFSEAIKSKQNKIFIHCEFAKKFGLNPKSIAFSFGDQKNYSIKCNSFSEVQLEDMILILTKDVEVIGYNIKSIASIFCRKSQKMKTIFDVMIAEFNLNSLERDLSLGKIIELRGGEYIDLSSRSPEEIEGLAHYIMEGLKLVQKEQLKLIKERNQIDFINNIEFSFIPVAAEMEVNGINVDEKTLHNSLEKIDLEISDLTQMIHGYADQEFNIDSPKQLSEVLFDPQGLNLNTFGLKKNSNGFSTAAKELAKLKDQHSIISLISKYRELTKIKNTYLNSLPSHITSDGKIHSNFKLTVAQTGRLSSNDPNLQNIPIKTPAGREVRKAFFAADGKTLLSLDYSQFELRLAAFLAEDEEFIEEFNNDADIHTVVASTIFDIPQSDVSKEQRRNAKVINFGILYGMSPHGLSQATSMTIVDATTFVKKYKEARSKVFSYMDDVLDKARKDGYVSTYLGRRRPTPDLSSSNFQVRSAAERATINFPIQGLESDIMKLAMIKIKKAISKDEKIVLQIHDSVILEVPDENPELLANKLQDIMEKIIPEMNIKLKVDYSIAKTWDKL
ncbi:MAG TPA: DNA polymerase I [Candidatus Saccharibacteria bacterium]|jgi:DNA polymerase-1|nr:DNA polymerase I [Candidatus Saccharibacteria bacterium]